METSAHTTNPSATAEMGNILHPTIAVVPVAGHGTRLRPLSLFIPKELLPVGDQLALWRIVEELLAAGMERIIFVVSPEKQAFVRRCFDPSLRPSETTATGAPPTFEFVIQETMRGLGDAVLCAEHLVGAQPFVVALGDAVFEEPEQGGLMRRLIHTFGSQKAALVLAVQPVSSEQISRYGIVAPVSRNDASNATIASTGISEADIPISDIVEKPRPEAAPSNLAAAARYIVTAEVFMALKGTLPDGKGEVQFTHALQTMLRSGKKGFAIPLRPREVRHDIGNLASYYRAFATFALHDPENGGAFRTYLGEMLQESRRVFGEHDEGK